MSEALCLPKGWDHRTTADGAGAALFEVWTTKHLGRALVAKAAPEPARAAIAAGVAILEEPDAALGPDPEAAHPGRRRSDTCNKVACGPIRRAAG